MRLALRRLNLIALLSLTTALLCGCRSPASHRAQADKAAYGIVEQTRAGIGKPEPFTLEPPSVTLRRRLMLDQQLPRSGPASLGTGDLKPVRHWPDPAYPGGPGAASPTNAAAATNAPGVTITLLDALQIAAGQSPRFHDQKESLFKTALALDLERDAFRSHLSAAVSGGASGETEDGDTSAKATANTKPGLSRKTAAGADLAAQIGLDLTRMLTGDSSSSLGVTADTSVSIPLLRGAGRHIAREPLTQAERDMLYAVYGFERFKQQFAVDIAAAYLDVLSRQEQVRTAWENYQRLVASTLRARRLAEAGRIPGIQVGQSSQSELNARESWVSAREQAARALDEFKTSLGIPPDAHVILDAGELQGLASDGAEAASDTLRVPDTAQAAPPEWEEEDRQAILSAMAQRMDLLSAQARVEDAQRAVVVAADALRAEVTLLGRAGYDSTRTSGGTNGTTRTHKGLYSALLTIDLPFYRSAERKAYRESLIDLEKAVRSAQTAEDDVKSQVRNALRNLRKSRESIRIQRLALALAQRRERSTTLFMEAGRAETRDLLEAQDALLKAQNALTDARVRYRVARLELQRDMGLLDVNENGLWNWNETGRDIP